MPRSVIAQLVLVLLLMGFYLATLGWRGVLLVADGRPAAVALGTGVLLLGAVGVWVSVREVLFGVRTSRLARRLAAEDGLPVDDLPRTAGGRVDRAAADAAFERFAAQTRERPDDWRTWYRLALAYDAAGDRRRARGAAREALARA